MTPQSHEFTARDFRFADGRIVPALRLHYLVLGNPKGEPVLVLHGTGGTAHGLLSAEFGGVLFGPGAPLDAANHFIVLPDAIGHGASAKPSDGLRTDFPRYDYEDMVRAQHLVVTQALGLRHLRLVLGMSMGGMHAWLWGIRHPGFMDALVSLAALPAPMAGRNWLLRRLLTEAIRNDPRWNEGLYVEQPPGALAAFEFFTVATNGGAVALRAVGPDRRRADAWLDARRAVPVELDANDLLYQWEASRDYDPSPDLGRLQAPALVVLSTDDERNPLDPGTLARLDATLNGGRLVLVEGGEDTRGHGTVGMARLWAEPLRAFLRG